MSPAGVTTTRRAVVIDDAASLVPAGTELRARLTNRSTGPIRGVATWLTPYALWPHVADWRRVVELPPGASLDVVSPLGPADDWIEPIARDVAAGGHDVRLVRTSLAELARIIRTARRYAGMDSGVSHLAGLLGAESTVLFGPTDPAVWRPSGPHVRVDVRPTADYNPSS